ncbi:conserved hypothetical protein [Rhodospirillaceae bacterium LM-1]|nr:conserved hypothetical protein [Rhodospirillaceae bacterium LM-1]
MSWLVFGVFAGIGLILLMRWLSLSKPGQAKRALTWGLVSIIVLTAAFLAMTGRLAWAGAALSALIPWAMRGMQAHALWRQFKSYTQGTSKTSSGQQTPPRPGQQRMSSEEAHAVLGLKPGASSDEIQIAYKRLIQKMHPDAGGSDALAAQINQARDVLMGKR